MATQADKVCKTHAISDFLSTPPVCGPHPPLSRLVAGAVAMDPDKANQQEEESCVGQPSPPSLSEGSTQRLYP